MRWQRLASVLMGAAVAAGCEGGGAAYTEADAEAARTTLETVQVREVRRGTGEAAEQGRRVVVHYTGWLHDGRVPDRRGRQFDSSRTAGRPFDFVLGSGQVIPGWERGVAGMKEGGVRELVIPGRLGYGASGSPPVIPPDATLVFEIELVDVR